MAWVGDGEAGCGAVQRRSRKMDSLNLVPVQEYREPRVGDVVGFTLRDKFGPDLFKITGLATDSDREECSTFEFEFARLLADGSMGDDLWPVYFMKKRYCPLAAYEEVHDRNPWFIAVKRRGKGGRRK